MTNNIKVGIYGASGYAGQNLVQIIMQHPCADLIFAVSNSFEGQPVTGTDLRFISTNDAPLDAVDAVFLALPHKASAKYAKIAQDVGVKVIDLSADLRFEDPTIYQKWYDVEHPHPELLPVPYGLPEIHRSQIKGVDMVGIPGCYPTATLLGIYPLLSVDGISLDAPIIVDAKSGISGAGRSASDTTHFINTYGNLIPYKVGHVHRHVGEIEKEIRKQMPITEPLIFTPHLVPIDQGLMASIYVTLNYNITSDKVHNLYENVYGDEPLVDVKPIGTQATFKDAQYKNNCAISITPVTERYIQITSVIDNLRKGAASQAVQCLNLMYDFAETTALL